MNRMTALTPTIDAHECIEHELDEAKVRLKSRQAIEILCWPHTRHQSMPTVGIAPHCTDHAAPMASRAAKG